MPMGFNFGPRLERFAYNPIEKDAFINILYGSVRSGKTWTFHPKIIQACSYPIAGRRLLTGVSKQTIYINVLSDLFNLIGPKNYHYNASSGLLRLFNSDWMVMGAKDEGSEKYVRGSTIGLAFGDEISLLPQSFYNMLITRLSPQGARFYGTTNPDNPMHWLKTDVIDNKELRQQKMIYTLRATMDDNPNLTEEFKARVKASFKGMFYQRMILGLWVMAEGAIYSDSWSDDLYYDDDTRPIALLNEGGHQDRWVSIDCGVDHPQVYGEFYDDGDTVWMEREYWWDSKVEMRQKTDAQYADDLVKFMGPNKACQILLPPECASFRAELTLRGLWVSDADNSVAEGIQSVVGLMSKRKFRVHKKNCTNTMRQLLQHCWDPKKAKRGVEEPLKINDDGADMVRYGIHTKIPKWRLMAA